VGTLELSAVNFEPADVLGTKLDLLRIETVMHLASGQKLPSVIWADRTGEIIKTLTASLQQETYRTTREVALGRIDPSAFDLGFATLVPVDRPLAEAHATKLVRYRVRLPDADPASVFINGLSQEVRAIDEHTAEVTVRAIRPDRPAAAESDEPPTEADRGPNPTVESDDPVVQGMAQEAAGESEGPWETAIALERYVHATIAEKNFSTAFATAAEVAQTREGDCTEHAVLLAALARSRGIPARVAVGLVYVASAQAFGYHMWDELYVNGQWIPMDATLGRGGIGGGHLKLAHSNLEGTSAYSTFLPVAQVLGRLKIEVVEEE
jgi:hypothetical protein